MKKAASISFLLLMITAMLHISVATHYCGGNEVASKVSLTGKLANCGMEGSGIPVLPPGHQFSKHCCEDVVAFCGTDNNFQPSFNFVPEPFRYSFQFIIIPSGLNANAFTGPNPLYTYADPPAVLMSTDVDISCICNFRI
jgi:hypothetical protein